MRNIVYWVYSDMKCTKIYIYKMNEWYEYDWYEWYGWYDRIIRCFE